MLDGPGFLPFTAIYRRLLRRDVEFQYGIQYGFRGPFFPVTIGLPQLSYSLGKSNVYGQYHKTTQQFCCVDRLSLDWGCCSLSPR
jgi:hypothetical protein